MRWKGIGGVSRGPFNEPANLPLALQDLGPAGLIRRQVPQQDLAGGKELGGVRDVYGQNRTFQHIGRSPALSGTPKEVGKGNW